MIGLSAVRAYLQVESDGLVDFYTAKITKTLVYTIVKELRMYRGVRGIVSPIHMSPLFKPGRKEWELGELASPVYVKTKEGYELKPLNLDGEYIIHVGGVSDLVHKSAEALEALRTPLQVKIDDAVIRVKLEELNDITEAVKSKAIESDRITIYLKSPAKLFNIYTPTRLPKYSISAPEVLMTPYMLYKGDLTMAERVLLEASRLLGTLVETYYSINTVKPIQVPLNNAKDPGIIGKITYIVEARNASQRGELTEVLNAAEIAGIGESRTNGFGTITWTNKK